MTSERILVVHWAPDPHSHMAACGEDSSVSYLDGKNKHYRHVYVTLSLDTVNCSKCQFKLLSRLTVS